MKKAPISVIIPCYNAKDTIEKALQSVFNQTFVPAEVIVIDDGSNDGTTTFLESLDYPIKVIYLLLNHGVSYARNTGWNAATQEYVAFLDADDEWSKNKIEFQLKFMSSDVDFSAHRRPLKKDFKTPVSYFAKKMDFSGLLFKNYIPTSSVILKRKLPYRFNRGKIYAEDYKLWLDMLFDKRDNYFIDADLAWTNKEYVGESGLSSKHYQMQKEIHSLYADLLKSKKISIAGFIIISTWEYIKYVKRVLLLQVKKLSTLTKSIKGVE